MNILRITLKVILVLALFLAGVVGYGIYYWSQIPIGIAYQDTTKTFQSWMPFEPEVLAGDSPAPFAGIVTTYTSQRPEAIVRILSLPRRDTMSNDDAKDLVIPWLVTRFGTEPSIGSTPERFIFNGRNGYVVGHCDFSNPKHIFILCVVKPTSFNPDTDGITQLFFTSFKSVKSS